MPHFWENAYICSRAANDPTVFTITEKAPTRAFSWLKVPICSVGGFVSTRSTGDRPKGAGGAAAPPRKNNSACRNENRAIVSTVMKILSEQKLEVC